MNRSFLVLVINPGSTSTKLSLFSGEEEIQGRTVRHDAATIGKPLSVQRGIRFRAIETFVEKSRISMGRIDAVAARGGLMKPVRSGVYRVNDAMIEDLLSERYGRHASNLGAPLADEFGRRAGCGAFIVDPVVVDELEDAARLTGLPEIERRSIFHALNQKSVAREVARTLQKSYEACNFIVAHMGGGVSVGAHRLGRVVDVNNALEGEGPFSVERSGGLPAAQVVRLCFEGKLSREAIMEKIAGSGGIVAHCGTRDFARLRSLARAGDGRASLVLDTLCLRISQEICRHHATLNGEVDRIILTGGMAYDGELVGQIAERVGKVAPVEVLPGEREMLSLAAGALRVLKEEEEPLEYG